MRVIASGWMMVAAVILVGCVASPPPRLEGSLRSHSDGDLVSAYAEAERHRQMSGGAGGLEQDLYVASLRDHFLQRRTEGLGWTDDERRDVYARRVREGMNRDMVLMAWGMPWEHSGPERSPWGEVERWWWGWESYYSEPWREVTFRDGVVIWWTERPEFRP